MTTPFTRTEGTLLALVLALLAAALFGPPIAQHANYHAFADHTIFCGVPHAMDVLSNLPFAAVALAAAWALWRSAPDAVSPVERAMTVLLLAGLMLTAAGSSWYHLDPNDAGLVIDRGAMAVAFAGLLGLAACRVSARAGAALGSVALLLGPLAVHTWAVSGNLLPWVVLQGGGIVLIMLLAWVQPTGRVLPVRWMFILVAYGVAKALEAGDHWVWQATHEWVSGHSLKHVVAALAVLPVITALGTRMSRRQNALQLLRAAP